MELIKVKEQQKHRDAFEQYFILRQSGLAVVEAVNNVSHDWIYNTWLPFKKSAELNPFIYSFGNTPLFNNQLCYQTKFNQTKLQDRIGTGHGSVGEVIWL